MKREDHIDSKATNGKRMRSGFRFMLWKKRGSEAIKGEKLFKLCESKQAKSQY